MSTPTTEQIASDLAPTAEGLSGMFTCLWCKWTWDNNEEPQHGPECPVQAIAAALQAEQDRATGDTDASWLALCEKHWPDVPGWASGCETPEEGRGSVIARIKDEVDELRTRAEKVEATLAIEQAALRAEREVQVQANQIALDQAVRAGKAERELAEAVEALRPVAARAKGRESWHDDASCGHLLRMKVVRQAAEVVAKHPPTPTP